MLNLLTVAVAIVLAVAAIASEAWLAAVCFGAAAWVIWWSERGGRR
jgi:hypothetical protein